jgi:hypothetical protein
MKILPLENYHTSNWIRIILCLVRQELDEYMRIDRASPGVLAVHSGAYLSILIRLILLTILDAILHPIDMPAYHLGLQSAGCHT